MIPWYELSTNYTIQKTYAPDYVGFVLLLTAYLLV
jgi:hypothetical protein